MFALLVPLVSLLLLAVPALSTGPGEIVAPAAGTAVQPGAAFAFDYRTRADYGVSSFACHVWLLTGPEGATNLSLATPGVTGYYFGRFDYANYPAVPYPTNPPPPQLTMPDFSQSPGGFAAGAEASNLTVQLTVIEEYGDFQPTVGRQLHTTSTTLIYNATSA